MAITPKKGKNGLIYASGLELEGANQWAFNIETETIAYSVFGDTWESNFAGIKRFSGSLTALHDQAAKILQDCAMLDGTVALLLYPDRGDTATYYSGTVVMNGFGSEGAMDSAVGQTADFTGHGAPTLTGFS